MKRELSPKTYRLHVLRILSKQMFSKTDVQALTTALNSKCNELQLNTLLELVEQNSPPTELGALLRFETVSCMVNGQRLVPIFAKPA